MHFSIPRSAQADDKLCLTVRRGLLIKPPTIYVVDHDAAVRDSLSATLTVSGFEVRSFESGSALMRTLPLTEAGCLLVEFDLEDMTGMELAERLEAKCVALPIIMMSARLRLPVLESKPSRNVVILQKPFGREELLGVMQRALIQR